MPIKNEQTYIERADQQQRKLERKLITNAGEHLSSGVAKAKEGGQLMLAAVRDMRKTGQLIIESRSQKQLTLSTGGADWFENVREFLPKDTTLLQVLQCVQIARSLPDTPQKLADCREVIPIALAVSKQMDLVFHREAQQIAHPKNDYAQATDALLTLSRQISAVSTKTPFPKWPRPALEQFVRNARPVLDQVRQAEEILSRAGGEG